MKKRKILIYIIVVIIMVTIGFFIYKVLGQDDTKNESKAKTEAEIGYLDEKFVSLFNQMRNITFENYKILSVNIDDQNINNKQSSENSNQQSGSSQSDNSTQDSKQTSNQNQEIKKYEMQETGVLTGDSKIDWKQVKADVEVLYNKIYPFTLDLYQTSVKQANIIKFNKEYDNLTIAVKAEDKNATLIELAKLYNYLTNFAQTCINNEKEKVIMKTKNQILQAYSILDSGNWKNISNNVNNAIQEFTKLVTDITNTQKGNQYSINKAYVMINELANAVEIQDKEVFLIKYKNVLEDLQNL